MYRKAHSFGGQTVISHSLTINPIRKNTARILSPSRHTVSASNLEKNTPQPQSTPATKIPAVAPSTCHHPIAPSPSKPTTPGYCIKRPPHVSVQNTSPLNLSPADSDRPAAATSSEPKPHVAPSGLSCNDTCTPPTASFPPPLNSQSRFLQLLNSSTFQ